MSADSDLTRQPRRGRAGSRLLAGLLAFAAPLLLAPSAGADDAAAMPEQSTSSGGGAAGTAAAALPDDPHALIERTSQRLFTLIDEARGYVDEDPDRFYGEVEALLEPIVDFQRFAKGVMAAYGRRASPEQIERFADTFKNTLIRTYAVALTDFEGGEVRVVPPEKPPVLDNRERVKMEVELDDGSVHEVLYSMFKNDAGQWKVYNLAIDNSINVGILYRNQFKSAMENGRFGGELDRVIVGTAGHRGRRQRHRRLIMRDDASAGTAAPAAILTVEGPVGFDNLVDVRRAGERFIDAQSDGRVRVDLAAAAGSGSAAAAALTAWLRRATRAGIDLELANVPEDLADLIRVSGLDEVLTLPEDA